MARFVIQDGGTFYVHDLDPEETEGILDPEQVFTYPWHVGDYDLVDAQLARVWFLDGVDFRVEHIFV